MSEAIDELKRKIALTQPFADNANYAIGLTIKEGRVILAEFENRPDLEAISEQLLKACRADSLLADIAIAATPTGALRNKLTSINIQRLVAIAAAEGGK